LSEKEEAIRDFKKAMKEILAEHKFELDKPDWLENTTKNVTDLTVKKEETKTDEKIEECDECGVGIRGKPKYCPGCGGELDWPE